MKKKITPKMVQKRMEEIENQERGPEIPQDVIDSTLDFMDEYMSGVKSRLSEYNKNHSTSISIGDFMVAESYIERNDLSSEDLPRVIEKALEYSKYIDTVFEKRDQELDKALTEYKKDYPDAPTRGFDITYFTENASKRETFDEFMKKGKK